MVPLSKGSGLIMTVQTFKSPLNHRMDGGVTPHVFMNSLQMDQIDKIVWDHDSRSWFVNR